MTDDMNFPTTEDIRKAVDGRNDMIHAVYQYQCRRCRSVELIGLGCGVEGPRQGATEHAYIASPFGCRCPRCGGPSIHINWQQDARFPLRDAPKKGRYFKVPKDGPKPEYFRSVAFSGEMGNEGRPIFLGETS